MELVFSRQLSRIWANAFPEATRRSRRAKRQRRRQDETTKDGVVLKEFKLRRDFLLRREKFSSTPCQVSLRYIPQRFNSRTLARRSPPSAATNAKSKATHCQKKITDECEVELTGDFREYVERFDFSIVKSKPIMTIINEYWRSRYRYIRFGRSPKIATLPSTIDAMRSTKLF